MSTEEDSLKELFCKLIDSSDCSDKFIVANSLPMITDREYLKKIWRIVYNLEQSTFKKDDLKSALIDLKKEILHKIRL